MFTFGSRNLSLTFIQFSTFPCEEIIQRLVFSVKKNIQQSYCSTQISKRSQVYGLNSLKTSTQYLHRSSSMVLRDVSTEGTTLSMCLLRQQLTLNQSTVTNNFLVCYCKDGKRGREEQNSPASCFLWTLSCHRPDQSLVCHSLDIKQIRGSFRCYQICVILLDTVF